MHFSYHMHYGLPIKWLVIKSTNKSKDEKKHRTKC